MPPRRSTTRNASATPAPVVSPGRRSNRSSSVNPIEGSAIRRATRGSSAVPVNNPRLPELQTQQSYAYGATKTPLLPDQLDLRGNMTVNQIAETIDVGIQQAERHLEEHAAETKAHLQSEARADRAKRRASRDGSREGSVDSENLESRKQTRTATWAATTLDSDQLDDIPEEETSDEELDDDETRRDTDPSSFPSGIYDYSYNYERGLRRPEPTEPTRFKSAMGHLWVGVTDVSTKSWMKILLLLSVLRNWLSRLGQSISKALHDLPDSSLVAILTTLIVTFCLLGAASFGFCQLYSNFICDPLNPSGFGNYLQQFCGRCVNYHTPLNITVAEGQDLAQFSLAFKGMQQQLRSLESRVNNKVESKYASIETAMESIRQEALDLSRYAGSRKNVHVDNVPSPLISKVNFFAPSNGALIDPRRTTPTRQRTFPLPQRIVLRMLGLSKHQSKPPITALEAWQDVGDCWCSSAVPFEQESVQLGITIRELVYPTELVLEHFPTAGSLSPDTAPRKIEIWADFEHLDYQEWESLQIRQMQGTTAPYPTYAMIGQMEYDASVHANHVQAFSLDVNQAGLLHTAQHFLLRVISNHGADHTCLYRVRLHGVPVVAHPEAKYTAEWYEKYGADQKR